MSDELEAIGSTEAIIFTNNCQPTTMIEAFTVKFNSYIDKTVNQKENC